MLLNWVRQAIVKSIPSSSESISSHFPSKRKPLLLLTRNPLFPRPALRFLSHRKMADKGRIAVCQMTSTEDKEKNMEVVTQLVEEISKQNVQMIFFPEACDYLCGNKTDTIGFSEPILGGRTVAQYCKLAQKHKVWLSMGGLHEKNPHKAGNIYNTHVIISDNGDIVQTYRKLHLFDVEIPEKKIRLKESDLAAAGQQVVRPVDTPIGRVGLAVCYDLRFPEMATSLTQLGAQILTYPSAFTYATGEAHWEVLLRSRAIENQCFVIAAAQVGHHNKKRRSYGFAMCVDPWGKVLASCGDQDSQPVFAVAEVDLKSLADVRQNMPVFQHRRGDLYKILVNRTRGDLLPEHMAGYDAASRDAEECSHEDNIDNEKCFDFSDIKIRASTVFYETALSYAFVNIRCVVPGHVLVAPKRVAKRTEDLTSEEITDFFQMAIKVQKVMESVHNVQSSNVTVQDGPDAGQTVEHVHCHIIPRRKNDFKDVDIVYTELAAHDARPSGGASSKPPRSLAERRAEAAMLRQHFTS